MEVQLSKPPEGLALKPNEAPPTGVRPSVTRKTESTAATESLKTEVIQSKPVQPKHERDMNICGDSYRVHYQQIEKNGETMTEISARKLSGAADKWDVMVTVKSDLVNTVAEREASNKLITDNVRQFRTRNKETCATDSSNVAERRDSSKEEKKDEERERIADGLKNCTLNKSGKNLNSTDRIDCWLNQLNEVDRRVGKHDDEEKLGRAVLSEMQKIVNGSLKRLIREGLLSDSDDRVDHAEEAVATAIETIKELRSTYELRGSSSRNRGNRNDPVEKMIGELSALKQGAGTKREGDRYADRAQEVRDDVRASKLEMDFRYNEALRNPLDPWAQQAYQQSIMGYSQSRSSFDQLQWDLRSNYEQNFLNPMKTFQSQGLLARGDYNEFSRPFADIQKFLREALNTNTSPISGVNQHSSFSGTISSSVLGSDFAIPVNLAATRAVGSTAVPRSVGISVPSSAPSLSFPAPRSIFTN
jgi:hypothetical protein